MLFATALTLVAVASWLANSTSQEIKTEYLVSIGDLPTSAQLSNSALTKVSLKLDELGNEYLSAADKPSRWYLTRAIRAGELIPKSALSGIRFSMCESMVVGLGANLASNIHPGDLLNLWAGEANTSAAIPVQIVTSAELVTIKTSTESFSQGSQSIELCISPGEIRSVVEAIANKNTVLAIRSGQE